MRGHRMSWPREWAAARWRCARSTLWRRATRTARRRTRPRPPARQSATRSLRGTAGPAMRCRGTPLPRARCARGHLPRRDRRHRRPAPFPPAAAGRRSGQDPLRLLHPHLGREPRRGIGAGQRVRAAESPHAPPLPTGADWAIRGAGPAASRTARRRSASWPTARRRWRCPGSPGRATRWPRALASSGCASTTRGVRRAQATAGRGRLSRRRLTVSPTP